MRDAVRGGTPARSRVAMHLVKAASTLGASTFSAA